MKITKFRSQKSEIDQTENDFNDFWKWFFKFNMVKKEVEEYGQHSKNFDNENKRLEHSVEVMEGPNDVWTYYFIFLKWE